MELNLLVVWLFLPLRLIFRIVLTKSLSGDSHDCLATLFVTEYGYLRGGITMEADIKALKKRFTTFRYDVQSSISFHCDTKIRGRDVEVQDTVW